MSPSTDATLRSLSLSGGATLKQADDPTKGFDPNETSYTASVAHAVASITVTATPNVSQATVAITWPDSEGMTRSGRQVSLNVGANTITVTVTATGGTTKEYTITVTPAASQSTDATLSALMLDPERGDALPNLLLGYHLVHGLGRPRCGVYHGHGHPQSLAGRS